jgi:ATP-dependent exoDNAse (exonuclease V) beta subunit
MERMPMGELRMPSPQEIRGALMHAGISPLDLNHAAASVRQALEKTLASQRGQWIFSAAHTDAHKEYAVTGVVDGEMVSGRVDRTFVDQQGVRWIVDFKTSSHEGADLEQFLDEQQRRYGSQMARYAKLFTHLGKPVRLGLYFPLLDAWREWAPQ